jgi:hypothetical protein
MTGASLGLSETSLPALSFWAMAAEVRKRVLRRTWRVMLSLTAV